MCQALAGVGWRRLGVLHQEASVLPVMGTQDDEWTDQWTSIEADYMAFTWIIGTDHCPRLTATLSSRQPSSPDYLPTSLHIISRVNLLPFIHGNYVFMDLSDTKEMPRGSG